MPDDLKQEKPKCNFKILCIFSLSVFLVVCTVLIYFDINNSKKIHSQNLKIVASFVGKIIAEDYLEDNKFVITDLLSSLLSLKTFDSACIYNNTAKVYLDFNRYNKKSNCPQILKLGVYNSGFSVYVYEEIILKNKNIGTLYLKFDLSKIYYSQILMLFIIVMFMLSVLLIIFAVIYYIKFPSSKGDDLDSINYIQDKEEYKVKEIIFSNQEKEEHSYFSNESKKSIPDNVKITKKSDIDEIKDDLLEGNKEVKNLEVELYELPHIDKTKVNILMIEDDDNFICVIDNILQSDEYNIIHAKNAKQGIFYANEILPSAIILDVNLPDLSGKEVLKRLKNNPLTSDIPVYVISIDDININLLKKGALKFLMKPVSEVDLTKAFQEIVDITKNNIKSILLVEDDPNLRMSIVEYFKSDKMYIYEANSVDSALKILKEDSVDCMVLDVNLGDKSGLDLLSHIDESTYIDMIPVVIYSGQVLSEEEQIKIKKYSDHFVKIRGVDKDDVLRSLLNNINNIVENKNSTKVDDNPVFPVSSQNVQQNLDDNNSDDSATSQSSDMSFMQPNATGEMKSLNLEESESKDSTLKGGVLNNMSDAPLNNDEPKNIEESESKNSNSEQAISSNISNNIASDSIPSFLVPVESTPSANNTENHYNIVNSILSNKKILVVDDDTRNIFALRSMLEGIDVDIVTAENGKIAVDKLNDNTDAILVLMDIMMPVMDGYIAIGEIRKDDRFKNLPIIALTAKAMTEDKEKCISVGANAYVSKPVFEDSLFSEIIKLFNK